MGFVRLFLGFGGRLSRAEFVIMGIILGLLEELTSLLVVSVIDARHPGSGELADWSPSDVAGIGVMIVFLWPMLCMTAKRYHDLDKSGWWTLLLGAPIVLGALGVVSYMEDAKDSGIILCALAVLAFLWPMIELGTFHGTPGDNGYGPRLSWKSLLPGLAKMLARHDREAVTKMARAVPIKSVKAPAPSMPVSASPPKFTRRPSAVSPPTAFGQRSRVGR